jgi:hypothetical protein
LYGYVVLLVEVCQGALMFSYREMHVRERWRNH